eukprot:470752-Pelagomonas_calceolata.AAC.1
MRRSTIASAEYGSAMERAENNQDRLRVSYCIEVTQVWEKARHQPDCSLHKMKNESDTRCKVQQATEFNLFQDHEDKSLQASRDGTLL